ncbi:MAG: gamma carbonic anhydrase family protein [Sulfobacillus thermosulfidooxidans]|nr:MAG: gamma carbonic anhydrase family protein [Sulfobacillus thermosulfidooxidans]
MLLKFGDFYPQVGHPVFVAPGSYLIGQVTLGDYSSVWFNAVIRADSAPITLGEGSNVQDNATLHADPGFPCMIGAGVTIGHGAIVHGAQVDDDVLIGMGAIIMNGSHIHPGTIIAAGCLVPQGMDIPAGVLVMGSPARIVRELRPEEHEQIRSAALHYRALWVEQGWQFR